MNKLTKIYRSLVVIPFLLSALISQGCSTHKTEILLGGLVGAAAGAGLGYGVVHHGTNRQYEMRNTLITSGVLAVGVMGVMALHYYLMNQQKVEIMSTLTTKWVDNPENQNKLMKLGLSADGSGEFQVPPDGMKDYALELDEDTRWVYPTFRRRTLRPETSPEQSVSSRYTWEVVRPGFFVNRETHPYYFEREVKKKISHEKSIKEFDPAKEAVTP